MARRGSEKLRPLLQPVTNAAPQAPGDMAASTLTAPLSTAPPTVVVNNVAAKSNACTTQRSRGRGELGWVRTRCRPSGSSDQ
jgi:hypothetical protein